MGPLRKAEEERLRAEHAAALAGFRALLSERHDITTATRWAKVVEWSASQVSKVITVVLYLFILSLKGSTEHLVLSPVVQHISRSASNAEDVKCFKQSLLLPLPCSIF